MNNNNLSGTVQHSGSCKPSVVVFGVESDPKTLGKARLFFLSNIDCFHFESVSIVFILFIFVVYRPPSWIFTLGRCRWESSLLISIGEYSVWIYTASNRKSSTIELHRQLDLSKSQLYQISRGVFHVHIKVYPWARGTEQKSMAAMMGMTF